MRERARTAMFDYDRKQWVARRRDVSHMVLPELVTGLVTVTRL